MEMITAAKVGIVSSSLTMLACSGNASMMVPRMGEVMVTVYCTQMMSRTASLTPQP